MRTTPALLAALLAASPAAFAQDTVHARSLAATCANCHGTEGRSATAEVPTIAGRPRQEIAASLRAFKAGSRPATVMHQLAKGYTDEQIDTLAAFFSAQKGDAR